MNTMIFTYEELKESVQEDYDRFAGLKFSDVEILYAIRDEYQYGEDYTVSEEFCILVILNTLYKKNNRDATGINKRLKELTGLKFNEIGMELGDEMKKVMSDSERYL